MTKPAEMTPTLPRLDQSGESFSKMRWIHLEKLVDSRIAQHVQKDTTHVHIAMRVAVSACSTAMRMPRMVVATCLGLVQIVRVFVVMSVLVHVSTGVTVRHVVAIWLLVSAGGLGRRSCASSGSAAAT